MILPQTIRLRGYQKKIIDDFCDRIRQGYKRNLIVAIMGAGKTVIAGCLIRGAVQKGKRCAFLVERNVLLDQTADTLRQLGIHYTVLQGDRPVDPNAPVIVASLQTIGSRLRQGETLDDLLGPVDVVVADEAHNTAFNKTYDAIESHFSQRGAFSVGLTATPWRLSKKEWLGQKFDALVECPQPPEIIKLGGAVPCRGFTLGGAFDLDSLRIRNGDFIDLEMEKQACRPKALQHVVQEHQRIAGGRPTLAIGSTISYIKALNKEFNRRGITSEIITGATPREEREAIFERVRRGITQVICSVGCLTTGFNLPCISCVLYVRATLSKALFYQSAGRGSRPFPGKTDYLLLDFGGNLKRFGDPMGPQKYDIRQPLEPEEEPKTKTCFRCAAEINVFAQICPFCGVEFSSQQEEEEDSEELVLKELTEFIDPFTRQKIANLRQWRKAAYLGDRSPDEAAERFSREYGHTPPAEWFRHACLTKRHSPKRKQEFVAWLERHSKVTRWENDWILYHLRLEFCTDNIEALDLYTQWWQILGVSAIAGWSEVKQRYQELITAFENDPIESVRLNLALENAREELASATLEVAQ